jgi:hypothetical protein
MLTRGCPKRSGLTPDFGLVCQLESRYYLRRQRSARTGKTRELNKQADNNRPQTGHNLDLRPKSADPYAVGTTITGGRNFRDFPLLVQAVLAKRCVSFWSIKFGFLSLVPAPSRKMGREKNGRIQQLGDERDAAAAAAAVRKDRIECVAL